MKNYKKISTHLLTLLTTGGIFISEQGNNIFAQQKLNTSDFSVVLKIN